MTPAAASGPWDVIVVGAGLGGLSAAAYLAAEGKRVCVLEQYDTVGGCTVVFRRQRKWEFDVGVHYLGDCRKGGDGVIPTMLRGLGLEDRIEFLQMDPDAYSTMVFPDFTFRAPGNWDRYLERLAETFPNEPNAVAAARMLRRVAENVDPYAIPQNPWGWARMGLKDPVATAWAVQKLSRLFQYYRLSPQARGVLDAESGVYASPPNRVSVAQHAMIMDHYARDGAWYPQGGGQVIPAHLVDVIHAHGGYVRTRARVEKILVSGGRVSGVRLAGGEILTAPTVVSNMDYKRTFVDLVGTEHLSLKTKLRAQTTTMSLPLFCVYLGLDVDIRQFMNNSILWYHPTYDSQSLYEVARAGYIDDELLPQVPIYVTSATLKDPDNPHVAPPGHSALEVMTVMPAQYDFWGVPGSPVNGVKYRREQDYTDLKQRITDALIAQVIRAVPELEGHIVYCESGSPLTQERYTLSSGGACYGLEGRPSQYGPFRPKAGTEIGGLFLTGASIRWGHGIIGGLLGGCGTAGAVLGRDLVAEVHAGHVSGDPSRLTAGGPGWDPLEASRQLGEQAHRRAKRIVAPETLPVLETTTVG